MAEGFQLGIGGPFSRVEHATRIGTLGRLILAVIGMTWVPLLALAAAERLITHRTDPMMKDLSVHTRLLLTLPLLLVAERVLDWYCGEAVDRLFGEGFIPQGLEGRARAIL